MKRTRHRRVLVTLWAAVTLALFASPVGALDVHLLADHQDWEVELHVTRQGLVCAATTVNRADEAFVIRISPDSAVELLILFDNSHGYREFTVDVVVTGGSIWQGALFQVATHGGRIGSGYLRDAMPFLEDLQKGTQVALAFPNGSETFGDFSLRGSRAAIDDLVMCYLHIADRRS